MSGHLQVAIRKQLQLRVRLGHHPEVATRRITGHVHAAAPPHRHAAVGGGCLQPAQVKALGGAGRARHLTAEPPQHASGGRQQGRAGARPGWGWLARAGGRAREAAALHGGDRRMGRCDTGRAPPGRVITGSSMCSASMRTPLPPGGPGLRAARGQIARNNRTEDRIGAAAWIGCTHRTHVILLRAPPHGGPERRVPVKPCADRPATRCQARNRQRITMTTCRTACSRQQAVLAEPDLRLEASAPRGGGSRCARSPSTPLCYSAATPGRR
jgi:hypothetical protein